MIVSREMTAADLVREHGLGIVTDDYPAAVLEIRRNASVHRKAARAGREWVAENLSWDRCCTRMTEIFGGRPAATKHPTPGEHHESAGHGRLRLHRFPCLRILRAPGRRRGLLRQHDQVRAHPDRVPDEAAREYNWNFLERLGVRLLRQDVRDFRDLERAAAGCDFIVHTAAQPAVTISVEDPVLDFTTNVDGSFNVLELARRTRIPAVCCATIHVYGNRINETLGGVGHALHPGSRRPSTRTTPRWEGLLTPLHASKRTDGPLHPDLHRHLAASSWPASA